MKDNTFPYLTKNVYSKENAFLFFQKTAGEGSNHWFILIVLSSFLVSSLRQQLVPVLCLYQVTKQWIIYRVIKVRILAHGFLQGVFRIDESHLFLQWFQSGTPFAV